MFVSSSAKVSQGGEEGEPGSDRHHRGYVLGRGIPGQGHPPGRRIPAGACSEGPGAPVAGKHRDLILELLAELQGDSEVNQGIIEPGDHAFYLVYMAHL